MGERAPIGSRRSRLARFLSPCPTSTEAEGGNWLKKPRPKRMALAGPAPPRKAPPSSPPFRLDTEPRCKKACQSGAAACAPHSPLTHTESRRASAKGIHCARGPTGGLGLPRNAAFASVRGRTPAQSNRCGISISQHLTQMKCVLPFGQPVWHSRPRLCPSGTCSVTLTAEGGCATCISFGSSVAACPPPSPWRDDVECVGEAGPEPPPGDLSFAHISVPLSLATPGCIESGASHSHSTG